MREWLVGIGVWREYCASPLPFVQSDYCYGCHRVNSECEFTIGVRYLQGLFCVNLETVRLEAGKQRGNHQETKSGYRRPHVAQDWRIWRHNNLLHNSVW